MLSYQHAFHAGNHADVIKHLCWIGVINALKKKDKPFTLFDTHAGAGAYDLTDAMSSKNKEYETGISRLLIDDKGVQDLPNLLADYLSLCEPFFSTTTISGLTGNKRKSEKGW